MPPGIHNHRAFKADEIFCRDRRPPVSQEVTELLLRMARDNPTWGYDPIQGALANLGHKISGSTDANTLKEHGIEPGNEVGCTTGKITCRERLGGILRYHYRQAA